MKDTNRLGQDGSVIVSADYDFNLATILAFDVGQGTSDEKSYWTLYKVLYTSLC